ncbi:hypothetical protein BD769DRAFT_1675615 [Suillus cothurnatus]|nr:hypothetical protein BD769DRAFT_1675615 [Suillus cothurnatus]
MEDFSSTLEATSDWAIISDLASVPAFKVIQQFRSLPDFLMFPVFLALRPQAHPTPTLLEGHRILPDMEIIHAMTAFVIFAGEARERRRSASDAFNYACQNWAFHLARAPNQWDNSLHHTFKVFWDRHLLSWLEAQWCLKGLQSCLGVLSKGQQLAKEHLFQAPESSLSRV